jgi:hypothetical protein
MEHLSEIVKIVTKQKISKIELLDYDLLHDKNDLYSKFYHGLAAEQFSTDEEAAKALYDTDTADPRYRKLKSRFRKRLLNTLFFIDFETASKYSDYQKAYLNCNRDWALARMLITSGARGAAVDLAQQVLSQSMKYEFHEMALLALKLLREHYTITGDEKNFELAVAQMDKVVEITFAELEVITRYQRMLIKISNSFSSSTTLLKEAQELMEAYKEKAKKYKTYFFELSYLRLKCLYYDIKGDYDKMVESCTEGEDFIRSHELFYHPYRIAEFSINKMWAYINLKDYRNGSIYANECRKLFEQRDNHNLFMFNQAYFLLAIHTGNYIKAADIFNEVITNPRFKDISPNQLETWRLFEAFLNYIFVTESLNLDLLYKNARSRRFNLQRFLNEVNLFSKDKTGYNVLILIIEWLFQFENGQYDQLTLKADGIKTYCSRYLKGPENARSNAFLKLLLAAERNGFDYDKTNKNTEKLTEELNHSKLNLTRSIVLEIIPYEKLWDNVRRKMKHTK